MKASVPTRKIDEMGRIVIPKNIREQLGLMDTKLELDQSVEPYGLRVTAAPDQSSNSFKTLDDHGRLQIPAEMRREFAWKKGTEVGITIENKAAVFSVKVPECKICGSDTGLFPIKESFLCEHCLKMANEELVMRWRNVFNKLAEEYIQYCEKSLTFEDLEDVHQARVKGRRLRALLLFLGMKKDHKILKNIKEAHKLLGEVRERDVLIAAFQKRAEQEANDEHAEVYLELKEITKKQMKKQKRKLEKNLLNIIDDKFRRRTQEFEINILPELVLPLDIKVRLAEYTSVYSETVENYRKAAEEFRKESGEALKALHEVRIKSKEIRYCYNFLGKVYGNHYKIQAKPYKKNQRQLGDINDRRDWLKALKKEMKKLEAEDTAIDEFKQQLEHELNEHVNALEIQ
ncbi:CHAD domain-containing protein [Alteribacillus sp. HJP-4]|uniref:CHAD domain-containing protein n=1 Tax=Alteribacillus sp. HJP-4 TaxID=2775394 RepID=UPI0035CD052A